jgi:hypothetical protein
LNEANEGVNHSGYKLTSRNNVREVSDHQSHHMLLFFFEVAGMLAIHEFGLRKEIFGSITSHVFTWTKKIANGK